MDEMKNIKILAVDDDLTFLESLKKVLVGNKYLVDTLSVSNDVLNALQKTNYDAVLLDINMPGINGIEVLKQIAVHNSHLPVIIISGQSTIKIAVEAMKLGAYDFIEKPIDIARVNAILKNAISNKELREATNRLINEISDIYKMVGTSAHLARVCNEIEIFAKSSANVLITGESGTGKELVARAPHFRSDRKENIFVRINCAAIPKDLLESELFGYTKGAFTGAAGSKIGKFEAADNGTILLDEIGEMEYSLQAKLLRVLEEGEIEVIGETLPRKIDVRVIAATNQDLMKKVEEGKFRNDLFHRLNVCRIHIPPLCQRREDILPLTSHFIERFNNEYNKQIKSVTTQAASLLTNHRWEGNVRELKNVIENAVLFSNKDKLDYEDIASVFNRLCFGQQIKTNGIKTLHDAKEEFEKEYLQSALINNNGKINETAEALGIDRTNLFKKLQKHGIK
jgi:DNA-binding NtrC family response regulator